VSDQLSTRQRVALRAVCRTILPAPISDLEGIALEQSTGRAEQLIASLADPGNRARLLALLTVLGSPIANLVLGGRAAALQAMERSDREEVLRGWTQSRVPQTNLRCGETGESHEVPGLYVAAASVFPTSSGVNPMITIMTIADHVARGLADRL
jgi:hypothetical protein